MDKEKKEKKIEVRFLLARRIHKKLKDKADAIDVKLASYIKAHIEEWVNGL